MSWYRNIDGKGSFGSRQVISRGGGASALVVVADVDADGDVDLLTSSTFGQVLVWENLGGDGFFVPKTLIPWTGGALAIGVARRF